LQARLAASRVAITNNSKEVAENRRLSLPEGFSDPIRLRIAFIQYTPYQYGSSGFAVVMGVGAAAPTPITTKIPNEPHLFNAPVPPEGEVQSEYWQLSTMQNFITA
jgi:hypothetical protein